MSISDFSDIAEIVAATATVITLLFVAFELRANRQQSRLAMFTTLDQSWNTVNAQLAQNPKLNSIFAKGMYDPDSLTDEEASQFFFTAVQYMNNHKSVWSLLNVEGVKTHHKEWLDYDISAFYSTPGGGKIYRTIKPTLPPGFITYVENQLKKHTMDFPNWRKIDD